MCCGTVCGGGVREGTMPHAWLAQLLAGFWSRPPLPTIKLVPSGTGSHMGGLMYVLGPCGSLQLTLLWGWEFLLLPQPPQLLSVRGFEALFPRAGTLGCAVCLSSQLFLLVYLHTNVGPPAATSPALSSSHCLAMHPFCPGCPSPPLRPMWMNVFFNSLVIGLPYSSIFWHFWLFLTFKIVVLLLVVKRGKVHLPTPPSWQEVLCGDPFIFFCSNPLEV